MIRQDRFISNLNCNAVHLIIPVPSSKRTVIVKANVELSSHPFYSYTASMSLPGSIPEISPRNGQGLAFVLEGKIESGEAVPLRFIGPITGRSMRV